MDEDKIINEERLKPKNKKGGFRFLIKFIIVFIVMFSFYYKYLM